MELNVFRAHRALIRPRIALQYGRRFIQIDEIDQDVRFQNPALHDMERID